MTDPQTVTKTALQLLRRVYRKWAIGLVRVIDYDPGNQRIHALMQAPNDYPYLRHRPDSVTGVHYIVNISELVYVLIWLLINDQVVLFMTEPEIRFWLDSERLPIALQRELRDAKRHLDRQEILFERLMAEYHLKFRRLEVDFRKVVRLGETFEVKMKLTHHKTKLVDDPFRPDGQLPIPLSFVDIGGGSADAVSGKIVNSALIYELKGFRR